jgi:ATP-dependent Clp protease protease subunit
VGRRSRQSGTRRVGAVRSEERFEELLESTLVGPSQEDKLRMVFLYGSVTEHLIGNVIGQLLHLAHVDTKPISLIISTYGGSVDELFSLYDVMKFLPVEVQTVAIGKVQSAGCHILSAGVKGKRLITASTRVMLHPISIMGGTIDGNIFQLENQVNEMRAVQDKMVDALVKETSASRERIEEIMSCGHDYYLSAAQAVELGIADRVIGG